MLRYFVSSISIHNFTADEGTKEYLDPTTLLALQNSSFMINCGKGVLVVFEKHRVRINVV